MASGGNFWKGATTGLMNAELNHLQQMEDDIVVKNKENVLKDGRSTWREANQWHRIGKDEALTVDADKVGLNFINPDEWKTGPCKPIHSLGVPSKWYGLWSFDTDVQG